jgi:hypothetical protein
MFITLYRIIGLDKAPIIHYFSNVSGSLASQRNPRLKTPRGAAVQRAITSHRTASINR